MSLTGLEFADKTQGSAPVSARAAMKEEPVAGVATKIEMHNGHSEDEPPPERHAAVPASRPAPGLCTPITTMNLSVMSHLTSASSATPTIPPTPACTFAQDETFRINLVFTPKPGMKPRRLRIQIVRDTTAEERIIKYGDCDGNRLVLRIDEAKEIK